MKLLLGATWQCSSNTLYCSAPSFPLLWFSHCCLLPWLSSLLFNLNLSTWPSKPSKHRFIATSYLLTECFFLLGKQVHTVFTHAVFWPPLSCIIMDLGAGTPPYQEIRHPCSLRWPYHLVWAYLSLFLTRSVPLLGLTLCITCPPATPTPVSSFFSTRRALVSQEESAGHGKLAPTTEADLDVSALCEQDVALSSTGLDGFPYNSDIKMQWAQVLESLHPHHRQLVALAWQIHFALQSYCLSLVGVSLPTTYSPRVGCWDWLPKWRFWSLLLGFSILLCLFLWSLCYFAASLDAFLVALLDLCPYCLPLTISWQAHSMIFYLAFIVWTRMNYTINRSLPILISCTSLPSHSATYSYEDNLSLLRIVSLLKSCIP